MGCAFGMSSLPDNAVPKLYKAPNYVCVISYVILMCTSACQQGGA